MVALCNARSIFAFGAMCYDAFPWDFWLQKDMSGNLVGSRNFAFARGQYIYNYIIIDVTVYVPASIQFLFR